MALISFTMFDKAIKSVLEKDLKVASDAVDLYDAVQQEEEKLLKRLEDQDQVVFRYCKPDGTLAEGKYPINPNGSLSDIAGICDPNGTVLGMMPHPERHSFGWQNREWTRNGLKDEGDGIKIFKSIVEYVERKF
jgi:phosphoribosylformylglycinamidine (FGAM) synthase-like amidotransferase family enzyme